MRRKAVRLSAVAASPLAPRNGSDRASYHLGPVGPEVESDPQNTGGHRRQGQAELGQDEEEPEELHEERRPAKDLDVRIRGPQRTGIHGLSLAVPATKAATVIRRNERTATSTVTTAPRSRAGRKTRISENVANTVPARKAITTAIAATRLLIAAPVSMVSRAGSEFRGTRRPNGSGDTRRMAPEQKIQCTDDEDISYII